VTDFELILLKLGIETWTGNVVQRLMFLYETTYFKVVKQQIFQVYQQWNCIQGWNRCAKWRPVWL